MNYIVALYRMNPDGSADMIYHSETEEEGDAPAVQHLQAHLQVHPCPLGRPQEPQMTWQVESEPEQ